MNSRSDYIILFALFAFPTIFSVLKYLELIEESWAWVLVPAFLCFIIALAHVSYSLILRIVDYDSRKKS